MATKAAVICVGCLATLLALVEGWSSKLYENSYDTWAPARRSYCVGSGGKCYASGQCCKGFVCATFDDFYGASRPGLNPEIPGFCVKEKDLHPCESSSECEPGIKCASLGRTSQRYCVPPVPGSEAGISPKHKFRVSKEKNGLGVACEDDSDCAPYTKDGKDQLCCQEIRRYRQKTSRRCDRLTPISVCIGGNKVRK